MDMFQLTRAIHPGYEKFDSCPAVFFIQHKMEFTQRYNHHRYPLQGFT